MPPAGTEATAWRSLLVGKYGPSATDDMRVDAGHMRGRWCGRSRCLGAFGTFSLTVEVGPQGGQIVLSQPDGTSGRAGALVEAEAARRGPYGAPAL